MGGSRKLSSTVTALFRWWFSVETLEISVHVHMRVVNVTLRSPEKWRSVHRSAVFSPDKVVLSEDVSGGTSYGGRNSIRMMASTGVTAGK